MPIYEYECPTCGKFEVIQTAGETEVECCATCPDPKRVQRVISASSFVLKGTGWYKTDYSSKPSTSAAPPSSTGSGAATESTGTPSSTSSEGSSESKAPEATKGCGTGCACH